MTSVKRYVGIDFGTSTSAVCYKDYYEDNNPVEEGEAKPVWFGSLWSERLPIVPTLVLIDDEEGETYIGAQAEEWAEYYPELLYSEFKMDLIAPRGTQRIERAEKL